MSAAPVARLVPPADARPESVRPYLGPAVAEEVSREGVLVRLRDGRVRIAELALAFTYEPVAGDALLTIADDDGCWVIGVLAGRGRASLRLEGDIDIASDGGSIRLHAARGVEIDAPEVTVRTRSLRTLADSLVERATTAYRSVREALTTHAGSSHTVVEGTSQTQAGSIGFAAREQVRVNGKAIHLG